MQDFLSAKPLYYNEIDYSRMPRIYDKIKSHLPNPKIIHLIGTNGKGTTGRFLASALHSLGFDTGHYTSPHILKFNERVWKNGQNIDDNSLEEAHKELQDILSQDDSNALSYFEYTTLLSLLVYKECEYVVMEAGLGGEHDATAVFDKVLTLVTPIAFDHEAFLGNSIESIATTKLNAIQKNAILAIQKESEVYSVAEKLSKEKSLDIKRYSQMLDESDKKKIESITKKLKLEEYLVQNLSLSISALKFLNIEYCDDNFTDARLFGRLTHISENVIVDVGHNPLAAEAIRDSLMPNKYVLVYNTYKDKDYKKILEILKPIVKRVEIIAINDERAESNSRLKRTLNDLAIKCSTFKSVTPNIKYLVFGSFSVVEAFIKRQNRVDV
ncbi:bifunctional folylpolyglutamate synthase/dihydro folate synthase [Sulfurimonas gotlandica GD1]|uniref:Bifunctional folylpolyglutamate synthase/dihydro folate synthase n=1 Tax=Sulfurimonas gotlandica (strain DSM 19862 / JCM 16533 / GD1) TaxID=929558 RepID=B6BKV5_SULGG|nr:folylpolyglutamate synthetase [Sulfurimonas gotlandica GD1]EHP29166.1 bifunctional folylpolyglutamate synthase/dihydro folate synthase [Sulfurimonas gotlandica GD1]